MTLPRVSAIDLLTRPHYGAGRKHIALLTDNVIVRKILDHLDLPIDPPDLAPALVAPELPFDA